MTSTTLTPKISTNLFQRIWKGYRIGICTNSWREMLGPDWQETILDRKLDDRFHAKQGRSVVRWQLTDQPPALTVYLKRHYILPRWCGFLAAIRPGVAYSPARQEAQNLAHARQIGLKVPETIAWVEYLRPGFKLQSLLAVRELDRQLPLHEAIPLAQKSLTPDDFLVWKRQLISELVRITYSIHERHLFHKDLYLCHFYVSQDLCSIVPETWQGYVTVIDLHRLAEHPLTSSWWRVKDLAQLLYSTVGVCGLHAQDAMRFWVLYRAQSWRIRRKPGRMTARWIRLRYANYLAQKQRRANRTARKA
jgi:heptose I phosphotransferase